MPRKAKEKDIELNKLTKGTAQEKKIAVVEKVAAKKTATSKTKTTAKKADSKSSGSTKKATKTATAKSTTAKKTAAKSVTTQKTSTKKTATTKSSTKKEKMSSKFVPTVVEYYDLPFRYNQTIVRILAQTPNILFIYWDVSDADRNVYMQKYGTDFFNNTRPYLIITNETMNYTFEVEINDFANSWYLHIPDANCEYKVELGRKFIVNSSVSDNWQDNANQFASYSVNDYLPITSSNEIEMPNDHILFDELGKSVFFRNVKTDIVQEKDISSVSFLQKIGKTYQIYDLYKEIYKDELVSDEFGLNLPSSHSNFKEQNNDK